MKVASGLFLLSFPSLTDATLKLYSFPGWRSSSSKIVYCSFWVLFPMSQVLPISHNVFYIFTSYWQPFYFNYSPIVDDVLVDIHVGRLAEFRASFEQQTIIWLWITLSLFWYFSVEWNCCNSYTVTLIRFQIINYTGPVLHCIC